MSLSATFTYLFNTSRNGDSTTSLDIFFQCLKSFSVKGFFLVCSLNHLFFSFCPATHNLGEEANPHPATSSYQVFRQQDMGFPELPFFQARQPKILQLFLISLVLQVFNHICCLSLDMFQSLSFL